MSLNTLVLVLLYFLKKLLTDWDTPGFCIGYIKRVGDISFLQYINCCTIYKHSLIIFCTTQCLFIVITRFGTSREKNTTLLRHRIVNRQIENEFSLAVQSPNNVESGRY